VPHGHRIAALRERFTPSLPRAVVFTGSTLISPRQVVVEYAVYLGIDVHAEGHLLWIAEEGLRAPLPPGFSEHADADGTPYFVDAATGASSWEHPLDQACPAPRPPATAATAPPAQPCPQLPFATTASLPLALLRLSVPPLAPLECPPRPRTVRPDPVTKDPLSPPPRTQLALLNYIEKAG
jgi:hypothetical protein